MYRIVFLRGFTLVLLVSLNTALIRDKRTALSVLVAMCISLVWWLNASASSKTRLTGRYASLWYALGAGAGTMVGLFLGGL